MLEPLRGLVFWWAVIYLKLVVVMDVEVVSVIGELRFLLFCSLYLGGVVLFVVGFLKGGESVFLEDCNL